MTNIIKKYHIKYAIDLGSGKGQDISRYSENLDKVLFIDIDETAIQELINRKRSMKNNLSVLTLVADLNQPLNITLPKIKQLMPKNVPLVVSNFTLHYLTTSVDAMRNCISLVNSILAPGGHFMFTVFDGEKVFNKLKNKDWIVIENNLVKYSIKKKYQSKTLETGQKIEVLLPFSRTAYEETLLDIEYFTHMMEQMGFYNIKVTSFAPLVNKYNGSVVLNKNDIEFVSLYSAVTAQKRVNDKK